MEQVMVLRRFIGSLSDERIRRELHRQHAVAREGVVTCEYEGGKDGFPPAIKDIAYGYDALKFLHHEDWVAEARKRGLADGCECLTKEVVS